MKKDHLDPMQFIELLVPRARLTLAAELLEKYVLENCRNMPTIEASQRVSDASQVAAYFRHQLMIYGGK